VKKGFAVTESKKKASDKSNKKIFGNERMFSWSPWPSANFQTKYPVFPLVMTILILFIGKIYISSVR
tara:strand:+ start:2994 stop:3194 length:201 start_codon:yes stop_codon:yes gene_type:complete